MSGSRRALEGRRILLTGAREKGDVLARLLRAQGADLVDLPLIRFEDPDSWQPLHDALDRLAAFRHLLLTSATAVDRFFAQLQGRSLRLPAALEITTVGPKTALALERWGAQAHHVAEDFRAEGVLALFARRSLTGEEILFPRAQEAREILVEELSARGARLTVVPVYRTAPVAEAGEALRTALGQRRIDAVTLTSASAARQLARLLGEGEAPDLLREVLVACLGPVTAEAARRAGLPPTLVPARSTIEDLVEAIRAHFTAGEISL